MNRLIVALDRALARTGEDVTLRRIVGMTNQAPIDVHCRAHVRGYGPEELSGSIIQGDTQAIVSPTEIARGQWPGGQPITSPPNATDSRVPRRNDQVIVAGKLRNVEAASPIYVGGELVRIELQLRG